MELQNCRENEQAEGLRDLIADLPTGITMAEVGCYRGESTLMFMQSGKVEKLYAIDTWRPGQFEIAEREFNEKLAGYNVVKLKMTMEEAVEYLPKLDFIYIDADHSYEWVTKDIIASLKVIKLGGIIGGHDYAENYSTRVVKAVDQILNIPDKIYVDTSWVKTVPKKNILTVAFAYNEIQLLPSMVAYYRSQGCDLLIVDNYSTDGTYEWLVANGVKTGRVDTDGMFHLEILQKALMEELHKYKPDWIIYTGIDIYMVFDKTIAETIDEVDKQGYNLISTYSVSVHNTGEERGFPLKNYYFNGCVEGKIRMIAKYEPSLYFRADSIQINKPKIFESNGVLINYGNAKPAEEREVTYQRRKKAWANGLNDGYGSHYRSGHDNGWLRPKGTTEDLKQNPHIFKYIKKIL